MKIGAVVALSSLFLLVVLASPVFGTVCPRDGEWPELGPGKNYTIVCSEPYFNITEFLSKLPPSVGAPTQAFLDALQITKNAHSAKTRTCEMNGTWSVVQGECTGPLSACWRRSYFRGVGVPFSVCDDGLVQSGLLCYPPCKSDYSGVGPVCWQECPPGYTDDGAFCRQNAQIVEASKHCPWYDVCGVGLAKGCTKCPEGYSNEGCLCVRPADIRAKVTYGRGAGYPLSCASGLEQFGGLCFPKCRDNFRGAGFECWANDCPANTHDCGMLCTTNSLTCETLLVDITGNIILAGLTESDLADWLTSLFHNPILSLMTLVVELVLTHDCT